MRRLPRTERQLLPLLVIFFAAIALLLQQGYLHARAAAEAPDAPSFKDVSAEAGVVNNRLPGIEMFAGQAWGDYDNDGWVDLYVTDPAGPNTLYRNHGDGTFTVAALAEQVALPQAYSQGAIFADYDNDGWKDLFVANWGQNTLFRNDQGRAFTDVTAAAGLAGDSANSKTASWGDFDGDGWLDLYVANWSCYPKCGRQLEGDPDRLYHNQGDGTFRDVSDWLGGGLTGAGFVASFIDFDNDGDLDLYLVNDAFVNPVGNKLWRNDGPGCKGWCFAQIAHEVGADARVFGMGLAAGDYDNDGDTDFYFSNVGPMTLLRQEEGRFEDAAAAAGVQAPTAIAWGAVFLDYDNDGWRDLYLAVSDTTNHRDIAANRLFRNQGDGSFAAACQTEASDVRMSIGAASADYDRDGWVDLLVGNMDEGYRLYRNQGGANGQNHWLALELVGGGPVNRDAVGARVTLTANGVSQMQEIIAGASVGAGHELALYFGLGGATSAEARVRWPDGTEQALGQVQADRRYRLSYPGDLQALTPAPTTAGISFDLPSFNPAMWLALAAALLAAAGVLLRRKQALAIVAAALVLLAGLLLAAAEAGLPARLSPNPDARLAHLLDRAGVRPPAPPLSPSPALVRLGEALYWDPELSGNRDIACATCHLPAFGAGDALAVSIGVGGRGLATDRDPANIREFIPRNAQPVFDLGYRDWRVHFWDGRVFVDAAGRLQTPASDRLPAGLDSALAAQAMFPVTSREEMRGHRGEVDIFGQRNELAMIDDYRSRAIWQALMQRLLAIPGYRDLFTAAFPGAAYLGAAPADLTFVQAANAIAAYETVALTFADSPFDRYLAGEREALSPAAKRGAQLFFGKAQCAACHSGPLLSDQQFHNLAVPQIGDGKGREQPYDLGRARETGNDCDRYAFRTPSLRNVALTGPYMHNGAYASLPAVIRHHLDPATGLRTYDPAQLQPALELHNGPEEQAALLRWYTPIPTDGVALSGAELADLIQFLDALTSPSARDLAHLTPASVPSGLTPGGL
jgi:cytochrome c peroxidase